MEIRQNSGRHFMYLFWNITKLFFYCYYNSFTPIGYLLDESSWQKAKLEMLHIIVDFLCVCQCLTFLLELIERLCQGNEPPKSGFAVKITVRFWSFELLGCWVTSLDCEENVEIAASLCHYWAVRHFLTIFLLMYLCMWYLCDIIFVIFTPIIFVLNCICFIQQLLKYMFVFFVLQIIH